MIEHSTVRFELPVENEDNILNARNNNRNDSIKTGNETVLRIYKNGRREMTIVNDILGKVNEIMYTYILIIMLVGTGIYFTIRYKRSATAGDHPPEESGMYVPTGGNYAGLPLRAAPIFSL